MLRPEIVLDQFISYEDYRRFVEAVADCDREAIQELLLDAEE